MYSALVADGGCGGGGRAAVSRPALDVVGVGHMVGEGVCDAKWRVTPP